MAKESETWDEAHREQPLDRRARRTNKKRARFLKALAETCNVSRACEASNLSRRVAYDWRDADPKFKLAWEDALDRGAEVLEDEARRRAFDGVDEPVFQGGKNVGTVRKYSDTLLIFLLKGAKPKKYSDRNVIAGDPESPLSVKVAREDVIRKLSARTAAK